MKRKTNNEKSLFQLVENIGHVLSGDLHVIDISERYPEEDGERSFRVYHEKGYCFDIEKSAVFNDKGKFLKWDYIFFAEWEGFVELDVDDAIKIVSLFK